jgi:hypothetical protein
MAGFREATQATPGRSSGHSCGNIVAIRESAMEASNLDNEPPPPPMPTVRDWLRVVAAALAIVMICILWTFWA